MWLAWGDKVAIRRGLRLTRVVGQLPTIFEFQRGEPAAKWVSDFVIHCLVMPRVIPGNKSTISPKQHWQWRAPTAMLYRFILSAPFIIFYDRKTSNNVCATPSGRNWKSLCKKKLQTTQMLPVNVGSGPSKGLVCTLFIDWAHPLEPTLNQVKFHNCSLAGARFDSS